MGFIAIASFLSGYLHQDWDAEFASDLEAGRAFASSEPAVSVVRALEEGALLLSSTSDDELSAWLAANGCYYAPDPGVGAADWLRELLGEVAATLAEREGKLS